MTKDEETRKILFKLIDALLRKGGLQDGNWGFPAFHDELRDLKRQLRQLTA